MVAAALDAGAPVEALYCSPEASHDPASVGLIERAVTKGVRVLELMPGVIERVTDAVTPQPVLAVVRFVDVELSTLAGARLVIVCSGVRDPGNAGTVLRSADAAGADAVVMCDEPVDVYNPKAVRASAGALFQVPVVVADHGGAVVSYLADSGLRCLGAVPRQGTPYTDVDLTGRVAVVFGNESAGLPPDLDNRLDARITIPMAGRAESLNVGMATSVVCFETARQRREANHMVSGSGPDLRLRR